ncbi:MAG: ATP-dependent DNA helicase RecQ [Caldisericaceae bacterium]|nr:ATP-dependent DNA helicase RecQ [Caldisericaceae bacterium]
MEPKEALQKYFGFSDFREPQEKIINQLLQGHHVLAIMPTGSGKSILYQLSALLLPDLTLVISPLIALMKDQVDALRKKGIEATFINASLSKTEREKRQEQIKKGRYKLLYVTPERFRKEEFWQTIKNRTVSLFAVDEAHCISEWGHDFRPDYTRLGEIRQKLGKPTTIALTATATPKVQQDIVNQLHLERVKIFHTGIDRPNLFLGVEDVFGEQEKLSVILKYIEQLEKGSGIVYFALIQDLIKMSERLRQAGAPHLIYHGKLDANQRKKIQNQFMNSERSVALATNAFGMGIDKYDIRFVLHAQIPGSLEAYYQEIGRAGRDDLPSDCILLYDQQDLNIQMEFIKWNNPSSDFFHRAYQILHEHLEEVNANGLEYFKEQLTYKNRHDYRAETVLSLFDRWGVTTGSIEEGNLQIIDELPEEWLDEKHLEKKLKAEQMQLYQMMRYAKLETCRKAFIHEYFGIAHGPQCGACDNCRK